MAHRGRRSRLWTWMQLAAAALLIVGCRGTSHLSHTSDQPLLKTTTELCPDSPNDLEWIGHFNLTHYKRQPRVFHWKHRRSLDEGSLSGSEDVHTQADLGPRMQELYKYPLLLPTPNIQTAVSNLGDTRRLDRVLAKFLLGEPVRVVALGGSVTSGHGPENKQTAWLYRVFDWMNATFPNPNHRFVNHAVPAVTSGYIAPCVLDMVTEDTDLVLLEFTYNDGERSQSSNMQDPTRLGLERLVRKLLRIPGRPAVLNLHYHPFNNLDNYWSGGQDHMEVIFKYYGVPSLSMRSALHRLLDEHPWLWGKIWREKDVHPSCVGSKYVSDIVIGFLQDLCGLVLQSHPNHQRELHTDVLYDDLPPPLFEGNTADQLEKCILNDDFRALAQSMQGWQWVDEPRGPGQHRWGFISWTPGDVLLLKIPIEEFLPALRPDRRLLVGMGVLMTYEHAGWLQAECMAGCSCPVRQVNSHHQPRMSMTYWKAVNVTVDEGSQGCQLKISNTDKFTSGEAKVKLSSLLVSQEIGSFIESWRVEPH